MKYVLVVELEVDESAGAASTLLTQAIRGTLIEVPSLPASINHLGTHIATAVDAERIAAVFHTSEG